MEKIFKILFFIAVLVFCVLVVGIFMLIIKIILLYLPEVKLFGITMTTNI